MRTHKPSGDPMKITAFAVSCLVVASSASAGIAADVKTPLACKLGAAAGTTLQIGITNSTKAALKKDTSLNFIVKTRSGTVPGTIQSCFALDAPLAAKAAAGHSVPIDSGATPLSCSAFLSSTQPSLVRSPDGSTSLMCDTQ